MAFCKPRTAFKNRVHSTLTKYALNTSEHSDIFVGKGRAWLNRTLKKFPPETGRCLEQELNLLDATMEQITVLEERICRRKGHATAVGAVARHLAESAFWILNKGEVYQDPALLRQGSPKQA